jgi:phosphocarrier protein
MVSGKVTATNQIGLHARPATAFVQKANEFKSSIWIEKDERHVNAKSLLGVLSMGVVQNIEFTIIADGVDEENALAELIDLVENKLGD